MSVKAKTNFLRCISYLSFTKDRIKLLLKILALVLLLNFLSKALTSCLTAIISHVIKYCKFGIFLRETVYETSNKKWFRSVKNSGEVLSELKCRGFRATSLSTYDISTLYNTLPHNLIKDKLLDLIEWTFKRASKIWFTFLACNDRKAFSLPLTKIDIHFGHVRMYATLYPISWKIFVLDLEPSYTDKLLEFRWVQIAALS